MSLQPPYRTVPMLLICGQSEELSWLDKLGALCRFCWVNEWAQSQQMQKLGLDSLDYLWLKETYHSTSFFHTHRTYSPMECKHSFAVETMSWLDTTFIFSRCWFLRLWVHSTSSRLQVKAPLVCAASEMARQNDFDFKMDPFGPTLHHLLSASAMKVAKKWRPLTKLHHQSLLPWHLRKNKRISQTVGVSLGNLDWTKNWAMPFDQYLRRQAFRSPSSH